MADKDAKVRLNLAAAGFLTAMQQLQKQSVEFGKAVEEIGGSADKANRRTSGFFSAMKAGASGAGRELTALGNHLKTVLATAATLGGSLSIGGAIKQAQDLQQSYKDIAFAIRVGTGSAQTWQGVQQDVEAVASRWKRSNQEVAESYEEIFKTSGDAEASKKGMNTAAMAANATGAGMRTTTALVNELGEKFGITGDRMDEAMAKLISRVPGGKAGLEELGENLGLLGASARAVGLDGEAGLSKVLGMLNASGAAGGKFKRELMATIGLLDQLGDADQAKNIETKLGVHIRDKTGATRSDALDRIMAATGGKHEELSKAFTGPTLRLLTDLGKNFEQAFAATKGDKLTKTAAGIDALHRALDASTKGAIDGAKLQQEANERNKDAQRNLQAAMNDFVKAFERPEVVHAVDQLAAQAPKLAATMGSLVEFASAHPAGAAAAVVGGVAAKGALTAVITKVSEGAMDSAGKLLGKGLESSWTAGGKLAGASFVIAAGAAGYEIGKQLADYFLNKDEKRNQSAEDVASTAEAMVKHGTGTAAERKQTADALRAQIADQEKGQGTYTETIGAYAAKFAGDPGLDPRVRAQRRIANLKTQLAALEQSSPAPTLPQVAAEQAPATSSSPPSAEARKIASEVARGDGKVIITNEQAMAAAFARAIAASPISVRVLDGGGTGSNGMPPAPGNGSGSAPRG